MADHLPWQLSYRGWAQPALSGGRHYFHQMSMPLSMYCAHCSHDPDDDVEYMAVCRSESASHNSIFLPALSLRMPGWTLPDDVTPPSRVSTPGACLDACGHFDKRYSMNRCPQCAAQLQQALHPMTCASTPSVTPCSPQLLGSSWLEQPAGKFTFVLPTIQLGSVQPV